MSAPAYAQDEDADDDDAIIVTASRRAVDVSTIPYNISAVSGEQIEKTGVVDIQTLTQQVPNVNLNANGNGNLAGQVPIIRGLNASGASRSASRAQPAVTTYIGNVQTNGYIPINDVQRVEVLRGPQGTLYGGGALGGTIRIIPNDPEIGVTSGYADGTIGTTSHSDDVDYSFGGMVNLPLGEMAAFRISAKHERQAGYIDKLKDVVQQSGPYSPAELADPGDFFASPAVYEDRPDYNWSEVTSVRAAIRVEPSPDFDATASFTYAHYEGEGNGADKPRYPGGIWFYDSWTPTPTAIPALGEYETFNPGPDDYMRDSYLGVLDMNYDLGFATLSSTTSYLESRASNNNPGASTLLGLGPFWLPLYAGYPSFPRYVNTSNFLDGIKDFTQEIRLVSNGTNTIDYTIGFFYQNQRPRDTWDLYAPGLDEWAGEPGVGPRFCYWYCYPFYPDSLGRTLSQVGQDKFKQAAVFGEATLNVTPELHVTGGFRWFNIDFERSMDFNLIGLGYRDPFFEKNSESDIIFKGNVQYDFSPDNMIYATFSQGFRRGGANTIATVGVFAEYDGLLTYKSDRVDNFEIGIKGRLDRWRYTLDVFQDNWHDPQIDGATPFLVYNGVFNASEARSRGVEFELSGPLSNNFDLVFGYAYSNAVLTEDICIPANSVFGVLIPCAITGTVGGRLPGAPDHTASGTLSYHQDIGDNDSFGAVLNVNYKGSVLTTLANARNPSPVVLPDYALVNLNVSYTHGPFTISVFARNLFNTRGLFASSWRDLDPTDAQDAFLLSTVGPLNFGENAVRPRQIGLNLRINFR